MPDTENVAPQDPSRENSPIDEEARGDIESATFGSGASCKWNDKEYSDGGAVCDAHIRYKCWDGKWVEVGQC